MADDEFETSARVLEAHADYRVLRLLAVRNDFGDPGKKEVRRAAIVDTETTGLTLGTDKAIEPGLVVFEYAPATGEVFRGVTTTARARAPRCRRAGRTACPGHRHPRIAARPAATRRPRSAPRSPAE